MQRSLLVAALCLVAGVAQGASFIVSSLADAGVGSLRDAVGQANATPESDTITFTVAGTIVLTTGAIQITAPITITGPGAANLTIDGNANNRVFTIAEVAPAVCPAPSTPSDYLVSISGLTLRNAHRNTDNTGGAIFSLHSLALDGMVIRDNAAKAGAGLSFLTQYANQSLTITNSEFHDNLAKPMPLPSSPATGTIAGGAIRIAENCTGVRTQPVTVTIANSLFEGNRAQPVTQSGRGGAITAFSYADISITDSRFVDNAVDTPNPFVSSYLGGALWASARSVSFLRTEIASNFADVAGAIGFFNDASDLQTPALATDVSIVNSTISNNTSTGSPIVFGFGNVAFTIANSTIVGNTASHNGTGGVAFNTGATVPPTAQNALGGSLQIDSSILWNRGANNRDIAKNATNLGGPMTVSVSNSFIGEVCDAACGGPITLSGAGNQIGIDPQVDSLKFNGGSTRTRALLLGSPAIGAGSNPLGLLTEQRGAGFARVEGSAPDVGAYEYVYPAACAAFIDVPGSSPFCANVAWLKNRKVTLGCAIADSYCPADPVIRLAMAAFMKRLGDALTPTTIDVQQTLTALDLLPAPHICQTGDIVPADMPRRAVLDAVTTGLAAADAFSRIQFQVSNDGGASWRNLVTYGTRATFEAGLWRNARNTGQLDLPAGDPVRFGILIDAGNTPTGATVIGQGTCHLRVRVENSNGFSLP
jgi:hypothetical protein